MVTAPDLSAPRRRLLLTVNADRANAQVLGMPDDANACCPTRNSTRSSPAMRARTRSRCGGAARDLS